MDRVVLEDVDVYTGCFLFLEGCVGDHQYDFSFSPFWGCFRSVWAFLCWCLWKGTGSRMRVESVSTLPYCWIVWGVVWVFDRVVFSFLF